MDRHDFLNEVVDEAMELFNDRFKTEYSRERIFIKYVNAHNGDKLIPQFIDEYFPDVKDEEFCAPGFVNTIRASAFAGVNLGIVIRDDIDEEFFQLRHSILHELGHLYAAKHEFGGRDFYREYCETDDENDVYIGTICAGHQVWRELIAEKLACMADCDMLTFPLEESIEWFRDIVSDMEDMPSDFKLCMSAVLVQLFTSREFEECDEGDDFLAAVDELGVFDYDSFFMMFALFHEQMKKEKLYEIDLDFIENVGAVFLRIKTDILTKNM